MKQGGSQVVVMGASAGALDALSTILPCLESNFPLPIVVVTHVPADRRNLLPELLAPKCRIAVREAMDKEPIEPSTIYFAPPDYHLLVENERVLSLSSEEPVNYARPSIDVLFESAAQAYRSDVVGIILTGANHDGAQGLRAIVQGGGIALGQRPDTAQVATMPQMALNMCPDARVLTLAEIASYITEVAYTR